MAETQHLNKHVILLLAFISCLQVLFIDGRPIKPMNKQEFIKHGSTNAINLHQSMQTGSFSDAAAPSKDGFRPTQPGFSPGVGHLKAVADSSSPTAQHSFERPNLPKSSQIPYDNVQQLVSGKENGFYASSAAPKDGFRPTSPVFSPGVGHPKAVAASSDTKHSVTGFNNDNNNLHKSSQIPDDNVQEPMSGKENGFYASTAASKDGFRPTAPGFSPGVGHPKAVAASFDTEHSIAGFKNDDNNLHKSSQIPDDNVQQPVSEKENGFYASTAASKDGFRPTAPGFSPGAGHPKAVAVSSETEHSVTGFNNDHNDLYKSGLDVSAASSKDDLRPTAPGFSPGAGHPANIEVTSSDIKHSVTGLKNDYNNLHKSSHIPDSVQPYPLSGKKETSQPISATGFDVSAASSIDDFRPIAPGFSPGVDHPKEVATSSSTKHSVTGITNDYRPTHPGHSPGVGHSYEKINSGQNP